jgi:uncharacterized protein (TIGR02452 family)
MKLHDHLSHYFKDLGGAFHIITPQKDRKNQQRLAVASLFTLVFPLFAAIGFGITSCLSQRHVTPNPKTPTADKVNNVFNPVNDTPSTGKNLIRGANTVEIYNNGHYINNKEEKIELKSEYKKEDSVEVSKFENYAENLAALRKNLNTLYPDQTPTTSLSYADMTTQDAAIAADADRYHPILLNFANETHAGGGPGIYFDEVENKFIFVAQRANAQEETIIQDSTFGMKLLYFACHHVQNKETFPRSHFLPTFEFNSENMALVTRDQLFATTRNAFVSELLDTPIDITTITSAAVHHEKQEEQESQWISTKKRIDTHLLAAAKAAVELKTNNSKQKVDFIFGAFGCGAFAPKDQAAFAQKVAKYYKEKLEGDFAGFFDKATAAAPVSFRIANSQERATPNDVYQKNANIFRDVFAPQSKAEPSQDGQGNSHPPSNQADGSRA